MPGSMGDTAAFHTRPSERAALAAGGRPVLHARAMATASHIFSAGGRVDTLPTLTASTLAAYPGQMCLVSLAGRDGDGCLRPVAVAHENPTASRRLQRVLARHRQTPADAFSREVFRSAGALRMVISSPRVLRLWLPDAYWGYVDRTGISGVLAAALRHRERVIGAVLLFRERGQPGFDELDQAYVVSLAQRLGPGFAAHPSVASSPPAALG